MNPVIIPQFPGDAGTIQTLEEMRRLVSDSYLHPWIRERAASLTQGGNVPFNSIQSNDHAALLDHVRRSFKFVRDPTDMEVLADPVTAIEARLRSGQQVYGDCAQMASYLAALLKAIGHNPSFKAIGSNAAYSHVFVDCEGDELDPTLPRAPSADEYERYILAPL